MTHKYILNGTCIEIYSFSNGRLSALRLLRIRKVANYVVQKLELELPLVSELKGDTPSSTPSTTPSTTPGTTPGTTSTIEDRPDNQETGGSSESEADDKTEERVLPEQYIEIICNNKVLCVVRARDVGLD